MAASWRHPTIPDLQPWAKVVMIPFGFVVIVATLPLLVAVLPVIGLMWLGAKR